MNFKNELRARYTIGRTGNFRFPLDFTYHRCPLFDDVFFGGSSDDTLLGMEGNDTLSGDTGADTLIGEAGSDTLHGGTGKEFLEGGADRDTYHFNLGDGRDIINDTDDDRITFGSGIAGSDLYV